MDKNSPNKPQSTKAGALLCPSCCAELVEVEFDCEVDGVIVHNVKALKCPSCGEEVFTPRQYEEAERQIKAKSHDNI